MSLGIRRECIHHEEQTELGSTYPWPWLAWFTFLSMPWGSLKRQEETELDSLIYANTL